MLTRESAAGATTRCATSGTDVEEAAGNTAVGPMSDATTAPSGSDDA
jgi:hypothetical protein